MNLRYLKQVRYTKQKAVMKKETKLNITTSLILILLYLIIGISMGSCSTSNRIHKQPIKGKAKNQMYTQNCFAKK